LFLVFAAPIAQLMEKQGLALVTDSPDEPKAVKAQALITSCEVGAYGGV